MQSAQELSKNRGFRSRLNRNWLSRGSLAVPVRTWRVCIISALVVYGPRDRWPALNAIPNGPGRLKRPLIYAMVE